MNRLKALFPVLSATPGRIFRKKPETVADTLIPSEEEKKAMAAASASAAETGQDGQPEAAMPAGGEPEEAAAEAASTCEETADPEAADEAAEVRKQPWSWRQTGSAGSSRDTEAERRSRMKLRIQRRNRRCPAKPRIHRQNPLFSETDQAAETDGESLSGDADQIPGRCRIFLQPRCRRRQRRRPRRPDLKSLPGMRNWRSFWRQRPA